MFNVLIQPFPLLGLPTFRTLMVLIAFLEPPVLMPTRSSFLHVSILKLGVWLVDMYAQPPPPHPPRLDGWRGLDFLILGPFVANDGTEPRGHDNRVYLVVVGDMHVYGVT